MVSGDCGIRQRGKRTTAFLIYDYLRFFTTIQSFSKKLIFNTPQANPPTLSSKRRLIRFLQEKETGDCWSAFPSHEDWGSKLGEQMITHSAEEYMREEEEQTPVVYTKRV